MVLTLDAFEVHDHIANNLGCLDGAIIRASLIGSAYKHSDWHLVDAADVDQSSLFFSLQIIGCILLEPVHVGVLLPVRLRLHCHRLAVRAVSVVTGIFAQLLAHLFILILPVGPVEIVDANGWVSIEGVLIVRLVFTSWADSARSKSEKLVQIVDQEILLKVGEGVEHLDGTLGPAEVENLIGSAVLLDRLDIGDVVVAAHLGPAKLPEVGLVDGERRVLLAVLGAAVIAYPYIVACLGKLEVHRDTFIVVAEPGRAIASVTMLDKNGRKRGREGSVLIASYMEGCEDVAIVCGDLNGVPSETIFAHKRSKAFILLISCHISSKKARSHIQKPHLSLIIRFLLFNS